MFYLRDNNYKRLLLPQHYREMVGTLLQLFYLMYLLRISYEHCIYKTSALFLNKTNFSCAPIPSQTHDCFFFNYYFSICTNIYREIWIYKFSVMSPFHVPYIYVHACVYVCVNTMITVEKRKLLWWQLRAIVICMYKDNYIQFSRNYICCGKWR